MTDKKNLSPRVQKARAVQPFVHALKKNKADKVTVVLVPGSGAKRYQVIIRRPNAKIISTECRVEIGGHNWVTCKGNSNGTVCYHSIAAIIKAAEGYHVNVSFCANYRDAKRLSNMNGHIGQLVSHQGKGKLWMVISEM